MISDNNLIILTEKWHQVAPETRGYVVCSMDEATHVVFSDMDLELAEEYGENLSKNHVYRIKRAGESDDLVIIDDKGNEIIGFDLYMSCTYLKENQESPKNQLIKDIEQHTAKAVSISEYRNNREGK